MMHNPLRGVITQHHENGGGYKGHRGIDIGARDSATRWINGLGQPVYACFAGVASNVVRWSKKGNRASTWAPGKTGNGLRVINADGEVQGYNHMMPLSSIKNGDSIRSGQLIGHLDDSGNQTAPHLHLETWVRNDPETHFDPMILFRKYGVNTMSDPAKYTITFGGVTMAISDNDAQKIAKAVWAHKAVNPRSKKTSTMGAYLVSGYANSVAVHKIVDLLNKIIGWVKK